MIRNSVDPIANYGWWLDDAEVSWWSCRTGERKVMCIVHTADNGVFATLNDVYKAFAAAEYSIIFIDSV